MIPATRNLITRAAARYLDPSVLPNRLHWLVLRKRSRQKVRRWLKRARTLTDDQFIREFQPTVIADEKIRIPDREDVEEALGRLTTRAPMSPFELDTYLQEHPQALTGNAEADLCPKHSIYMADVHRLRDVLELIMDKDLSPGYKLNSILEGPRRLSGLGKATVTTILMCWNDGKDESETDGPKYSKWTGHTDRALEKLGIAVKGGIPGDIYRQIWALQRQMLLDYPDFIDLSDVDLFMYFVDPKELNSGESGGQAQ